MSSRAVSSKLAALAADDTDDVTDNVMSDDAPKKGLVELAGEVHAEDDDASLSSSMQPTSRSLADVAADEHAYGSDHDSDDVIGRATEVRDRQAWR